MYYCDRCAEKNDWPVTMFRSLGTCEECGARAECSERSIRDLAGEDRVPIPRPEEMAVPGAGKSRTYLLANGGFVERPTPPSRGGHGSLHFDDPTTRAVSLPEEALERVIDPETTGTERTASCSASGPPPAPNAPAFARFLSAEGFARWVKRSELGDDPALNAHCVEARRRWLPYGVALGRALDRLPWHFPSFAPLARPYDWAFDR